MFKAQRFSVKSPAFKNFMPLASCGWQLALDSEFPHSMPEASLRRAQPSRGKKPAADEIDR
jgi:hypothetical protein